MLRACLGKWHLGDCYPYRPMDRGFDHSVYHQAGGVGQAPDYWGNDYFDDTYIVNGKYQRFEGFCTDIWFQEGISFIESNVREGRPFFAYISTNAPHSPFTVRRNTQSLMKVILMYRDLSSMEWSLILMRIYQN